MSASRKGAPPEQAPDGGVPGAGMPRRTITLELDEDTLRALGVLGDARRVLEELARSAAGDLRRPHERREDTDTQLRTERRLSDDYLNASEARTEQAVSTTVRPNGAEDGQRVRAEGTRRANEVASISAGRDTTDHALTGERSESETVLLHQREANEQLVVATLRAQELAEEAEAARQRAEASERVLREVAEFRELFIGILSHDLRNPLNAISMATATLLGRGHLDSRELETVERITRANQRITRMVTQMLDLTRVRLGGGFTLEREPTDLREVCRTVLDEFSGATELVAEGDLRGVWDQDRLQELLSNLVGNALEYAHPGTPVRVVARGDGARVTLEVTNHGPPIPAELLPHIFEPFRRGKQHHRRSKTGNLGLGLYIAKQIVLAHQGELDAHSADGTTTFHVQLPREPPAP